MSDAVPTKDGVGRPRQMIVVAAVFAIVLTLLVVAYLLFLRDNYVVLTEGVRPTQAAAIVAELDKRGVAYRLRDGGTTILVPEAAADATRLAIVGSDAAATGQIGFELFNKSDMGLTNFAQKINYQRALQGELVRTIMLMDGVESARVHLALPERALFRDDRTEPSAAVTIAMKTGLTADAARVAGIQRLVAAAVPDLPEAKVVVLDADGRVISPMAVADPANTAERPAELEERTAVEQYYRARARSAVEARLPGLRFQLRVATTRSEAVRPEPAAQGPDTEWTPAGDGDARNFRLRVIMITATPLNAEDQAVVSNAITPAIGIDPARGDALLFETGPTDTPSATPMSAPVATAAPSAAASSATPPKATPGALAEGSRTWAMVGASLLVVLGWIGWRARRANLAESEQEAFAQILRRQLALSEGALSEGVGDAAR